MGRIPYLIQRVSRMDFDAMQRTARTLRQKTGKATAWLFMDMIRCAVLYQAGYIDYKIAEMYRLTPVQRATQITRGVSNRIVRQMNDKNFWHFFDNKDEINALFAKQVKRAWRTVRPGDDPGDFAAWVKDKGPLIYKPLAGSSGQGISKHLPEEWRGDPAAFQRALAGKGEGILEECVAQHPAMAALCPTSVNTLRIATLLGDHKEGIVYAYIRIGNGNVVDNVDCGGMAAPVDLQTGRLSGVGANKAGDRYEKHPMTGVQLPGYEIPYWREATEMCLTAMHTVPQVRFVAWDVAITADGPVFIEGNSFPSHAIPQFAAHFPDGIGILPRFRAFIDF